jgi:nitrite reductase/ring-hydroxylating ferredoxin subunit
MQIVAGAQGPAIETPLDGTQYDLRTGKVLRWCPKDNPLRSILGALKEKVEPVDLPVYPVQIKANGGVRVRLS